MLRRRIICQESLSGRLKRPALAILAASGLLWKTDNVVRFDLWQKRQRWRVPGAFGDESSKPFGVREVLTLAKTPNGSEFSAPWNPHRY